MKKMMVVLVILSTMLILAGCAAVLIGAGVAGGIELSRDSAKMAKDTSFDNAYSATFRTLEEMGRIRSENRYSGKIEAEVKDSHIIAQIDRLTRKTVRIKITARRNVTYIPNVDLAQEILNRINDRL